MTAVLNPSSTRPNAALRPAPPAPTTTASYVVNHGVLSGDGLGVDLGAVLSRHGEAEVLDLL